jgi:hypothetical protein
LEVLLEMATLVETAGLTATWIVPTTDVQPAVVVVQQVQDPD